MFTCIYRHCPNYRRDENWLALMCCPPLRPWWVTHGRGHWPYNNGMDHAAWQVRAVKNPSTHMWIPSLYSTIHILYSTLFLSLSLSVSLSFTFSSVQYSSVFLLWFLSSFVRFFDLVCWSIWISMCIEDRALACEWFCMCLWLCVPVRVCAESAVLCVCQWVPAGLADLWGKSGTRMIAATSSWQKEGLPWWAYITSREWSRTMARLINNITIFIRKLKY